MAFLHIEKRMAGLPDPLRTFEWQIIIPQSGDVTGNVLGQTDLMLRSKSVTIPSRTIGVIESNFLAMKQRFPGRVEFGENLSIMLEETEDFKVTQGLNNWMNQMVNTEPTATGGAALRQKRGAGGYAKDIFIQPMKYTGEPIDFCFRFYNAYPVSRDDVSLAYDDESLVRPNFNFTYDFWNIEPKKDLI